MVLAGLGLQRSARAADDTEKGLLAGLGIAAATGKTSLGESAGQIEAGILSQDAIQQTGAIISMIANHVADSKKNFLLVGKNDTIDLTFPVILRERFSYYMGAINQLNTLCDVARLASKPHKHMAFNANSEGPGDEAAAPTPESPGFLGGAPKGIDIVGATMVDRSLADVTLAVDDRALINSVLMNSGIPVRPYTNQPNSWNVWHNPIPPSAVSVDPSGTMDSGKWEREIRGRPIFRTMGEPRDLIEKEGSVFSAYLALRSAVDRAQKDCPESVATKYKGWLDAANATLAAATSSEKAPAPLSIAAQTEALREGDILVLKIGVEHVGATSASRSGLLYALGWPNAATVSSGLVTSFRMIDPVNGQAIRTGIIRCAVRQSNMRRMTNMLEHREFRKSLTQPKPLGDTVCDFRVAITGQQHDQ